MDALVSVIIPVYNAERFLKECIQSVCNQTYRNLEILIINDGSSDDTHSIIDEYANIDSRIRSFSKVNSGPSDTRNTGLETATGDYVSFVDADDWIAVNMIESMVREMNEKKSDLVVCEVNQFSNDPGDSTVRRRFQEMPTDDITPSNQFLSRFISGEFDYANWNKLYKRSIIEENSIRFDAGIRIGEDLLFNLVYLNHSSKQALLRQPCYHYRVHHGSLFHESKKTRWIEHCKKLSLLENYCLEGKVTISSSQKSVLFQESTVFIELPSLISYLQDAELLFTLDAKNLFRCAKKDWLLPFNETTSMTLRLLLFTLRRKMFFFAAILIYLNPRK